MDSIDCDSYSTRQQPLHQAALLLVEGVALGAEEGEFLVGGVEDGGDLALFG
jgi:hypothetical protein